MLSQVENTECIEEIKTEEVRSQNSEGKKWSVEQWRDRLLVTGYAFLDFYS